jgi:hypothetical protein
MLKILYAHYLLYLSLTHHLQPCTPCRNARMTCIYTPPLTGAHVLPRRRCDYCVKRKQIGCDRYPVEDLVASKSEDGIYSADLLRHVHPSEVVPLLSRGSLSTDEDWRRFNPGDDDVEGILAKESVAETARANAILVEIHRLLYSNCLVKGYLPYDTPMPGFLQSGNGASGSQSGHSQREQLARSPSPLPTRTSSADPPMRKRYKAAVQNTKGMRQAGKEVSADKMDSSDGQDTPRALGRL